jgi:3'-phosphoadenosine 5'-phosphosulfate sulfotransferase (PAPS reductase)/FAD synthetase
MSAYHDELAVSTQMVCGSFAEFATSMGDMRKQSLPRMSSIQHVVSVSGGKDSTAVYLLALESGRPFRAVMADVGNEHPDTYEFVSRLHERTGGPKVEIVSANFDAEIAAKRRFIASDQRWRREYDTELVFDACGAPVLKRDGRGNIITKTIKRKGELFVEPVQKTKKIGGGQRVRWSNKAKRRALELLHPTGNPYLDLCMWKGRFPSSQSQFCTEQLKDLPIGLLIVGPMLKVGPVLQWLGMRAEESERRRLQPRFNHHENGSMIWRPIQAWTEADVWAMHRRHGLRPNPLYAQGANRVGCWPCVNCGKEELRILADLTPADVDRIAEWERIVGLCSKRGRATFFAPKEKGVPIGIRDAVEWSKTTRGGRQYAMFFNQQRGGGCTSDLGLCERATA